MSNDLREMLSRRAVEVEIPSLVLDDLVTSGERRLRVRRAGAAVTGAATLALVVGGALAVTHGSDKAGPTPSVETPTQTPTDIAFPIPSGQTTVEADIRPGDIHGYDVLATLTNKQPEHVGASLLETTVTLHTDPSAGGSHVQYFCRGDRDLWFFIQYSNGGGAYGPCEPDADTSLAPRFDIEAGTPHHAPEPLTVRMWIAHASPEFADCDRRAVTECTAPPPAADPDAQFGFRVYEHQPERYVLEFFGTAMEAYSTIRNQGWLVDRAVFKAPDADRVAFVLPPSGKAHVVGVYTTGTRHQERCGDQHADEFPSFQEDHSAYEKAVDRVCGTDVKLLVDGQYVDPRADTINFVGDPWMYVEPGRHEVEAVVTRGDPRNVNIAVVIRVEHHLP